ncbi:MAG: KdsC family phosphatase [Armatimonadota bacterium]
MAITQALLDRLRRVKVLVTDVDGVLSDSMLYYSPDGQFIKAFNVRDGLGLNLLKRYGYQLVVMTGRSDGSVARRASDLHFDQWLMGVGDKGTRLLQLMYELGVDASAVAYVGDDLNDLSAFRESGVRFTVANASPEVRALADYVTEAEGGNGGMREIAEVLLKANGYWDEIIRLFTYDPNSLPKVQ